jgi:DNA polymerase III alpha subunit
MIKTNKFGEIILDETELFDQTMSGADIYKFVDALVEPGIDLKNAATILGNTPKFVIYDEISKENLTIEEFDQQNQQTWFMPVQYQQLDIAKHILDLCDTPDQLQRVGEELLLYQERNLFDLLRYLKYLVDTMKQNHLIWGVGRGSSLASYVLYLLGVHRIDSMYYELDPKEFLR